MPAPQAQPDKRKEGLMRMMPVITVLVALGYAVAAYFILFLPKLGLLVEGGGLDTDKLQQRIAEDQAYLTKLQEASKEFRSVNPQNRQRVTTMIPKTPDVPGLLVQMDAITKGNDMALVSIDANILEESDAPEGLRTVRVAMNIAGGTYEQFKRFLDDMERTLRIADVQTVIFTPGSGSFGVVLHTYALAEGAANTN